MISYAPLWETMKRKGITTYYLRNKNGFYNVSGSTLRRMRAGMSVSTNTLDALCHVLDCDLKDIVEFHKDTE